MYWLWPNKNTAETGYYLCVKNPEDTQKIFSWESKVNLLKTGLLLLCTWFIYALLLVKALQIVNLPVLTWSLGQQVPWWQYSDTVEHALSFEHFLTIKGLPLGHSVLAVN